MEHSELQNSILLVDKSAGCTSFDVIRALKKILRTKKIGHSGTLDRFASGLLVICTGQATKLTRYFLEHDKEYIGVIRLGIQTDTCDREGNITEEKPVDHITGSDIECVLDRFRGDIFQVPPQYSALKINGKRASDLARKGEKVELQGRNVTIHTLDAVKIDLDSARLTISVRCSKGTYIRALARDIGNDLNTGAYLESLKRTASGHFKVNEAATLEEIERYFKNENGDAPFIIKPREAFRDYSSIIVNQDARGRILRGAFFRKDDAVGIDDKKGRIFTIFDGDKNLIAIANIDIEKWHMRYLNVFDKLD